MMSLQKLLQIYNRLRYFHNNPYRVSFRKYAVRNDDDKESTPLPPKTSASAQLSHDGATETMQESPEQVQRMVHKEHVLSKINELDQRKLRHKEYAKVLQELITKPGNSPMEPKLPFKQPQASNNVRQSLRNCASMEEVLKLTNDPHQLANELVMLAWELATEKRKNDVVVESYLELKQELLQAKIKVN